MIVTSNDEYIEREHMWTKYVPTSAADDWHCKYHVKATPSLYQSDTPELRGYLYIEAEQYGFDEDVFVII